MLDIAQRKLALPSSETRGAEVFFVAADAAHLPFRDATFAWAAETLVSTSTATRRSGAAISSRVEPDASGQEAFSDRNTGQSPTRTAPAWPYYITSRFFG